MTSKMNIGLITALAGLLSFGSVAEKVCYTKTTYDLMWCGYFNPGNPSGSTIFKNFYGQPTAFPPYMFLTSNGYEHSW